MAIIISENGKNAKKLESASFGLEDKLQQYIYDNPESVPVYDIREDIRLLILSREFPTNSGPIDALGVDQDGTIYVVETKLYKNPDKRLVIAQALDYGASMWRHATDFDDFSSILETNVQQQFGVSLQTKLQEFFGFDDETVSVLLQNVRTNLSTGKFKFVVLMDQLHDRLKDLIIFINQNSQFDVYAVELDYYKHEQYEIIIPKLYGAEVKKSVVSTQPPSKRKKWDEASFLEDLKQRVKEPKHALRLFEYSKEISDSISWGTGADKGSANFIFKNVSPRSVYSLFSDGVLQLNFGWLDEEGSMPFRDAFRQALTSQDVINIPPDRYWISIPYDDWAPKIEEFMRIVKDTFLNNQ